MNKTDLKLIVCDVDGTLFDRKDTITEAHYQLKQMLKELKIPFTLASGRCYEALEDLIRFLDINFPVIVNNGTGIMDAEKTYWSSSMDPSALKDAVTYADEYGMMVSFFDQSHETVYRWNEYVQTWIDRFGKKYSYFLEDKDEAPDPVWEKLNIQKVLIIDPCRPGRIDQVIRRISDNGSGISVVCYDDRSADIMPADCDKSTAAARLASMFNIDMSSVMAIGDNRNDIGILESAGIGIAVRNAAEDLKEHADYVCREDGAYGVVEAIRKFAVEEAKI